MYPLKIGLLGVCLQLSSALIAYDCENGDTNITAISLRDVAPCPDPETGYQSHQQSVQVVQKNSFVKTRVQTCHIEVTRLIMYCGMYSHSSIVKNGLYTYIHNVGGYECRNIHTYRRFQFHGHVLWQIEPNSTTVRSVNVAGRIERNGACKGTYYDEEMTWKNVVVTATVKITIQDYEATVNLDENEINLRGGTTCSFNRGYCLDSTKRELVWNTFRRADCYQYSVVYAGPATIVQRTNTTNPTQYLVIAQTDKIFALALTKKDAICGLEVWHTEHPKLIVCLQESKFQTHHWGNSLSSENMNLMVYINSKFLYIELSSKVALDKAYAYTVHRRCLLRREILLNRLALAPLSPDTVSMMVKGQRGFIGRVAGEVLYILQCIPRTVEVHRDTKCYMELPVKVDNETYFMSPITHILQRWAEEIECNAVVPPLYYLNQQWTSFTPLPGRGPKPLRLEVDTETQLKFQPIQNLGSGGLYSAQDIRRAQDVMSFGYKRKAISDILTRKTLDQQVDNQGVPIFGADDQQPTADTISELWGWFQCLGTWTSGILGIYFVVRFLKFLAESIINVISCHRANGWSVKIFGRFWDAERKKQISQRLTAHGNQITNLSSPTPEEKTQPEIPSLPVQPYIVQEQLRT